jgi:hypothetical protein
VAVTIKHEGVGETGSRITLHGVERPGTVQTIVYEDDAVTYALQVQSDPGLPVSYRHYSIFHPGSASKSDLQRSRTMILGVAKRVEDRCGIQGLVSFGNIRCIGKSCPI